MAGSYSLTTRSTPGDGELKSFGGTYVEYDPSNPAAVYGVVGGGRRDYKYTESSYSKSPGKKGALGAVDGQPDNEGNNKGNTFTTTVLQPTMKVGQIYDGRYKVFKAFLSFNTSAIPTNATINS
ncbi:MAG: hypothetical protein ACMUIA_11220, partial [bacterium]